MLALSIDALALLVAAGLAADWWEGRGGGVWRAAGLGALAGLGLWNDPIVVPALAAAAAVLLVGMRGRFWRHWGVVAAGTGATVLGAAPWWIWWCCHSGNPVGLPAGARPSLVESVHLTWYRYLLFQGDGFSVGLSKVLALTGLSLAGAGIAAWLAAVRKRDAKSNFAMLGTALFAGLFVAAFLSTGFSQAYSGRYWIPFWPAMAVLAARACAGWGEGRGGRWVRGAAWAATLALAGIQASLAFLGVARDWRCAPGELARQEALKAAVDASGVDAVLGPRQLYPLNFVWGETVPVSDGILEFYGPIREAAEMAEHPGYLSDWFGVPALFGRMGLKTAATASGRLFHDVLPPAPLRVEGWVAGARGESAELELDPPRPVEEIGFCLRGAFDIRGLRIDVEVREGGVWRTLHGNLALPAVSWSGTRAYYDGGAHQICPVHLPLVEGVRIVARGDPQAELKGFDLVAYGTDWDGDEGVGADGGDSAVAAAVELAGAEAAVFAPRWLANRIHRMSDLPDGRNRGLSKHVFPSDEGDARAMYPGDRPVAVVVERRHAPIVRDVLGRAGIDAEEVEVDGAAARCWAFFRAGAGEPSVPLWWNGRWFSP